MWLTGNADPGVMHDITNGSNPACGSSGFTAVPGWDPVVCTPQIVSDVDTKTLTSTQTGLGTPDYPKMLGLFMSLP